MANPKMEIKIDLGIPNETVEIMLHLLGVWQDHNPDKRIVGERIETVDGTKHRFYVEICDSKVTETQTRS